jgi:hypothetical protein
MLTHTSYNKPTKLTISLNTIYVQKRWVGEVPIIFQPETRREMFYNTLARLCKDTKNSLQEDIIN